MDSSRPSKTKLKKEMEDLQKIGESLVELPKDLLKKFDLPDSLMHEILEAKNITQNGAKRRQFQFIGKIMRHIDIDPIRIQLEELKQPSATKVKLLHATESWRNKLLENEQSLKDFVSLYPTIDSSELELLISDCRGALSNKSKISYRKLFKIISIALQ